MSEEKDKIIVGALKECSSRESIENIFNLFGIDDKSGRVGRLNDCMGNPQTFFSSDNISVDDKYELTIQMFLTGSWKLSEYYERLGIGVPDGRI
jgi:hypothetical protein